MIMRVHACIYAVYMRVYIMYVCSCSYIYIYMYIYICVWIAPLGLEGAELPLF